MHRPNVLFVFPDQLSARWTGCGGDGRVSTPNMDRFAEESAHFTRAYSNSPVCTPYRGMLFTGCYPSQSGVLDNGDRLPVDRTFLPEYLNEAGYRTAYLGKWHLSGSPHCNRWVPPEDRAGFQKFTGWESHHVDHRRGLIWESPDHPHSLGEHETDGLTEMALRQLDELRDDPDGKPFCLFVSFQAPHPPCSPIPPYEDVYVDRDLCADDPNVDRDAWFHFPAWDADYGVQEFRRRYFSEITHVDDAFGRILRHLEESGLAENTIVLFTSDHGEMNGCHGRFGKGVPYEESVRVPLMIRVPGAQPHRVSSPVSAIDLFPTLLELCGVESEEVPCAGRSLRSMTENPSEVSEKAVPVFFEYGDWIAVVRDAEKLCLNRKTGGLRAFYDLSEDSAEMHSLHEDPRYAARISELRNLLLDWVNHH